jgi:hypothetical protein
MSETTVNDVDRIGTAAGQIWGHLANTGPASLTRLTRDLEISRELAMQAVGWLAREDKLDFEQTTRGRLIRLK